MHAIIYSSIHLWKTKHAHHYLISLNKTLSLQTSVFLLAYLFLFLLVPYIFLIYLCLNTRRNSLDNFKTMNNLVLLNDTIIGSLDKGPYGCDIRHTVWNQVLVQTWLCLETLRLFNSVLLLEPLSLFPVVGNRDPLQYKGTPMDIFH